ncbi:MAG: EAL domain-containing protein [Campylobacterales bacterium]|nr:EAL domain-containing protein [Campylobacterales bacterium]
MKQPTSLIKLASLQFFMLFCIIAIVSGVIAAYTLKQHMSALEQKERGRLIYEQKASLKSEVLRMHGILSLQLEKAKQFKTLDLLNDLIDLHELLKMTQDVSGWDTSANYELERSILEITALHGKNLPKEMENELFEILAAQRFGTTDEGYFFLNTFDGKMIVSNGTYFPDHPDIWETTDPNGIKVVQLNSATAQASLEGGFTTYAWKNPDGTLSPKISYVIAIPNQPFFLGAGVNLDYIEALLQEEKKVYDRLVNKGNTLIFTLLFFATLSLGLALFSLHKHLQKIIHLFLKTFERAAHEHAVIETEKITFSEFHPLARGANTLIQALQHQQAAISHQAHHDYLTNLPNRLLLTDRLTQAIGHAKRDHSKLAVVFMDLDHFKRVNDTLGHDAGDVLLQEMAKRFQKIIRESDTLARIGGDEFIFILANITKNEALFDILNRMIETVNAPLHVNHHELTIGCSLGIALYPEDGTSTAELIKNADIAMYEAKHKGRNTFQCFNREMDEKIHALVGLEREIILGIERGEFELYFQPKVETHTDIIIGAEALIRWNHPEKGLLYPSMFIETAEESGSILQLGKWVLEAAFEQLARWEKRGWNLHLAINLSVKQLEHPACVGIVRALLHRTGVTPSLVELEITESFSASGDINTLHGLKALGVKLAIDDFGTGYSSLSYLNKLPIDTLKIDRSFVQGIHDDPNKRAVTEVIIQASKIFWLGVVAEGVETEEDLRVLQELACPCYQGYLFSRPVPIPQFNALILKQR